MKFIAIFLLFSSAQVYAQADCARALQEICKDAPAGKISDCFKNSYNKLPAHCSKNMNQMQNMASDIQGSCMEEINKMCPMDVTKIANGGDVKKLVDDVSKCIQKNIGNMSAECKGKLKKINDTVLDGEMDNGAKTKSIR